MEAEEADLVLPCLYYSDTQALSHGFWGPTESIDLHWTGELQPQNGLRAGKQTAAEQSVTTGGELSTTEAAHTLTTFLLVQLKAKPFIELVYPMDLQRQERRHQLHRIRI